MATSFQFAVWCGVLLVGIVWSSLAVAHAQTPLTCPTGTEPQAGICIPTTQSTGLSSKEVVEIIKNVMNWLLAIFGFVAIVGFVISGIQYLTSAGDENMAETAKRNMKYSIIGVIVALSGWVIIQAIDKMLNATGQF